MGIRPAIQRAGGREQAPFTLDERSFATNGITVEPVCRMAFRENEDPAHLHGSGLWNSDGMSLAPTEIDRSMVATSLTDGLDRWVFVAIRLRDDYHEVGFVGYLIGAVALRLYALSLASPGNDHSAGGGSP